MQPDYPITSDVVLYFIAVWGSLILLLVLVAIPFMKKAKRRDDRSD